MEQSVSVLAAEPSLLRATASGILIHLSVPVPLLPGTRLFWGGQAVVLKDKTSELESIEVRSKTQLCSFPVTQFPHLKSAVGGDSGPSFPESRRFIHCLAGFLTLPISDSLFHSVKFWGIWFWPSLEARPRVHIALSRGVCWDTPVPWPQPQHLHTPTLPPLSPSLHLPG